MIRYQCTYRGTQEPVEIHTWQAPKSWSRYTTCVKIFRYNKLRTLSLFEKYKTNIDDVRKKRRYSQNILQFSKNDFKSRKSTNGDYCFGLICQQSIHMNNTFPVQACAKDKSKFFLKMVFVFTWKFQFQYYV